MDVILSQDGASLDEMFEALTKQQVEIVFTAHPTEVNKEELLTKHRQISDLLVRRDEIQEDIHATSYDRTQNERAIEKGAGPVDLDALRFMYRDWPWFRTTVDLIETLLAKSERQIAEHYDNRLVSDPDLLKLGRPLRERFEVTEKCILTVTGHAKPQDADALDSLRVRTHLMDVLNIIQVETLVRLRSAEAASEEETRVLKDALLVTINGIATGMRNSA